MEIVTIAKINIVKAVKTGVSVDVIRQIIKVTYGAKWFEKCT